MDCRRMKPFLDFFTSPLTQPSVLSLLVIRTMSSPIHESHDIQQDIFGLSGIVVALVDINSHVCEEWRVHFKEEIERGLVEVHNCNIFEVNGDAIVSPANSFGFMDGGIDLAISRRDVQKVLQAKIASDYHGELLVGQSLLVPTSDKDFPWVVSSPTMRAPADARATVNAYLAFRAALLCVSQHNIECELLRHLNETTTPPIKRILCPGLCTAVGRMAPDRCAYQMIEAYRDVMRREDGNRSLKHDDVGSLMEHHHRMQRYKRDISPM